MYLCPFSMYNLFFSISSQLSLNTYEMLKGKSGVKQKAKPNIKVSELQLCVYYFTCMIIYIVVLCIISSGTHAKCTKHECLMRHPQNAHMTVLLEYIDL